MLNKIILVGKVGEQLPSNSSDELRFVLQTKFTTKENEYFENHTIVAEGRWVEYCKNNLSPRCNVYIEGRLSYPSEKSEDGYTSRIQCLIRPWTILAIKAEALYD